MQVTCTAPKPPGVLKTGLSSHQGGTGCFYKNLVAPVAPESFSPCLGEYHSAFEPEWEPSLWGRWQDAFRLTGRAQHFPAGGMTGLAADECWVYHL